ncbi:MAG: class I SAM-dependent methyltransferase [Solirubrobacteraceae bacterium]
MSTADHEVVWARERSFHDALAGQLDIEALDRSRSPDGLDAALLQLAGDLRDRRILDAGCGQGDLTVALLERGARVTALDLSPGMVDVVRCRVNRLGEGPHVFTAVAAPLERSGLPDGYFDLVLGKFVLHHVDVETACRELRRLLRPGGRAIFIENAGDNPMLSFARKHVAGRFGVPRLGTEDEHPLLARDVDGLRRVFARVEAHYPVFEFFVLFDRQVLRFRLGWLSRIIRWIDDGIHRHAPRLRRFSYRVIIELQA